MRLMLRLLLALALALPAPAFAQSNSGTPANVSATLDRSFGSTRGAMLVRGPSAWQILVPGTLGQCLVSQGAGANPAYGSCAGASVTSVAAGNASLTVAPTVGDVLASINLANSNAWTALQTIAANSAGAFKVGLTLTNPAFNVDTSTASSATGINIKSAAAAAGVALSVISSGTNENFAIDAKGSGTITFGGVSTGAIILTRATTLSAALTYGGVALNNAVTGTGNMVLSTNAALTTPALGTPSAIVLTNGTSCSISGCVSGLGANVATALGVAVGSSGAFARLIATGTKALATSAIGSAACSSAQTATATGTLTTDVVDASFNGDPTAVTGYVPLTTGMLTIIAYPTADTVNFKVCNNTSASITPGAITLNFAVRR